jgi:hypothetical protein
MTNFWKSLEPISHEVKRTKCLPDFWYVIYGMLAEGWSVL